MLVVPEGHQLHGNEVFAGDGADGNGIRELRVGLGIGRKPGCIGFLVFEILDEKPLGSFMVSMSILFFRENLKLLSYYREITSISPDFSYYFYITAA